MPELPLEDVHRLLDTIGAVQSELSRMKVEAVQVSEVPDLSMVILEVLGWTNTAYMETKLGIDPSILSKFVKLRGSVPLHVARTDALGSVTSPGMRLPAASTTQMSRCSNAASIGSGKSTVSASRDPEGAEYNRRSIYRTWARGGRNPLLDTFDCPDPSTTSPQRGVTTTPLQALALLNNSFVLRMADRFAERVERETGKTTAERVQHAYLLAYGRQPTTEELSRVAPFVDQHGLAALCRVLINANEFLYIE